MYPNQNRRGRRNLILITILVITLFAFDSATGLLRSPVRTAGTAVSETASAVFGGIFGSGIFESKIKLAEENKALREEVATLQEELASAAVQTTENEELRKFAHLASTTAGVTAPVISSFTASPYGTFSIGAGERDGVQNGALVFSSGGFAIGTVVDVQARQALVREIFSPGSSIDVIAAGVPITLDGRGGGNAEGNAPRGSTIATSSPASAPALGGKPVGLVARAQGDASSAAVKVYVRSPVNFTSLQWVYVQVH
jgi:cell shape-determining protein MreC